MNTFGDAKNQFALIDAGTVCSARARFRRGMVPLLEHANHFYCPTGRWPFRGYLLLPRSDYVRLNTYDTALQLNIGDTALQLNIGDTRSADNVGTLNHLSLVQARCVTRGVATDPSALYLVELTDARGILHNRWFQFPITTQYNIRAPAYPQTFFPGSTNGGTTWTWTTMLRNMWLRLPLLGTWPGLPTTPIGTPEGFWFAGVPAWHSLCDVLEHLGMVVACDLTKPAPFTIVLQSAADAAYKATQSRYAGLMEDDYEWIDTGAGRVPKTVVVLFRRRNSVYGTEETVWYDALYQWSTNAVYSVSVAAPAAFTAAAGTHHLWSDFTVRYDMDGVPLPADTATAASIAAERATQYYSRISAGNYTNATYAGALPFTTGSQVDGVCWYMGQEDDRAGWRTNVVYGPSPPWPKVWED